MLILLPPSEGKSAPEGGNPTRKLSFPELGKPRTQVWNALIAMCKHEPQTAAKNLGLGVTQLDEVATNIHLAKSKCGPAIDVYTGVLYEALDAYSLNARTRTKLNKTAAISSALFGLVRPLDLIPPYRLSGNSTVTSLTSLPVVWREASSAVIAASAGPIIDMRSQTYVALGPIPETCYERAITLRVSHEKNGKRSVVSHFNKATKGALVRSLMLNSKTPKNTNEFLAALTTLGYEWEISEPKKGPALLDLITH
ncbi:unannotated protein [freshwater metagenome]|uniref:Unannotated protein n=1 Tax=freshwater metagenome TaxID=449393 RepID=A0A6J6LL21_9ZZZZ|nr:peroxide stress protein YaaA [Actinomycetota bacterium]MSY38454.1 peroxide stress protein YaaA [Actinomycetota bacterium]MSZ41445.1 peroxide stress protein YaaA [Actinomycetota bacterium]